MDCPLAKSWIPAYRAGALDGPDRRALECHLSGCEHCAGFFADGEALLPAAPPTTDESVAVAAAAGMSR
jgi:hypothetical protein